MMITNEKDTSALTRNGTLDDPTARGRHSRGFTVVELLIASAATMLVFAGTFTFIGSTFDSIMTLNHMAATQQRVRVSINEIARELTRAGTGLPSSGISVPDGTGATAVLRPGLGGALPTPNGVISIVTPGDGAGPTVADVGSDAVTIITVDQASPTWSVNAIDTVSTTLEVDFNDDIHTDDTELFVDDLLWFTNIYGSVFQAVTGMHAIDDEVYFADGDPIDINQPGAQFGNLAALDDPMNPGVYPPTTATRVQSVTYFLDDTDPDRPRLMRQRNAESAVIAEDIYNFQVQYDLFDFATNTETSDQDTTATPNQIRAVSIAVNGRSSDIDLRTGDFYHFGLLSKVTVRNTTFQNRYEN